ncbi:unnamed protein product [Heterobilharzia americana]|nr:unnamed protein product [Heterobilharzia americana]
MDKSPSCHNAVIPTSSYDRPPIDQREDDNKIHLNTPCKTTGLITGQLEIDSRLWITHKFIKSSEIHTDCYNSFVKHNSVDCLDKFYFNLSSVLVYLKNKIDFTAIWR